MGDAKLNGGSHDWSDRVDPALVRRMEEASTETLLAVLDSGTPDEQRQAAIELGDRGVPEAFDPLVRLLNHAETPVGDGAALGLASLGDVRAIAPILQEVQSRRERGYVSSVLVLAVTDLDPRQAVPDLAQLVAYGYSYEALHAARGLLEVWSDLDEPSREGVEVALRQRLREGSVEEWQAEWISEILQEDVES